MELVDRANRGDTAAFEELYRCYRDLVYSVAARRLGNADDARDVVQDTFLRVFARFPGFELRGAMAAYLYTVADRLCRDRRLQQKPTVDFSELDNTTEPLLVIPQRDDDTVKQLGRLSPEQRELLTLRFVDDLSLPQLAEALGAPVGTIKSRLNRAVEALRRKVDALQAREP